MNAPPNIAPTIPAAGVPRQGVVPVAPPGNSLPAAPMPSASRPAGWQIDVAGLALLLLLGFLVAWAALVEYTRRRFIIPPRRTGGYALSRDLPLDPSAIIIPGTPIGTQGHRFEQWSHRTADGLDLPVWDITGGNPGGPILIFAHGWGESRWFFLSRLAALSPLCSRLVCYDQRGCGDSPRSSRSTLGTKEVDDLLALIDAVRPGPQPLILYGFSLGAGVCIEAAAKLSLPRPASRAAPDAHGPTPRIAVIAECPYRLAATPAAAVLRQGAFPALLNTRPAIALAGLLGGFSAAPGRFDRAVWAGKLPPGTPLLVLCGENDPVSPPADAMAIASNAESASAKVMFEEIPRAGHTDLWSPEYAAKTAAAVADFVRAL